MDQSSRADLLGERFDQLKAAITDALTAASQAAASAAVRGNLLGLTDLDEPVVKAATKTRARLWWVLRECRDAALTEDGSPTSASPESAGPGPMRVSGGIFPDTGPFDVPPDVTRAEGAQQLRVAILHSLPLGEFDRALIGRLCDDLEPATLAAVASWCWRSWLQGMAAGMADPRADDESSGHQVGGDPS